MPREPIEDHELAACWTCRERNFCEITHSSNDHPGKLFRCINCKAVYPDFALLRPSPVAESTPTDATAVEAEREACARVADAWTATDPVSGQHAHMLAAGMREAAREIAAAIRSRTPKES